MREIELTRGKVALVDDADFEWLNQWKWTAFKSRTKWYAIRCVRKGATKAFIFMHRLVSGIVRPDHADGNGLNNQRHNLRAANSSQNSGNMGLPRHNTSGFKGVSWDRSKNKWQANIRIFGRQKNLGRFSSPALAALAYDAAAANHFGKFARLNFPNNTEHKPSKIESINACPR